MNRMEMYHSIDRLQCINVEAKHEKKKEFLAHTHTHTHTDSLNAYDPNTGEWMEWLKQNKDKPINTAHFCSTALCACVSWTHAAGVWVNARLPFAVWMYLCLYWNKTNNSHYYGVIKLTSVGFDSIGNRPGTFVVVTHKIACDDFKNTLAELPR